MTIDNRLRQMVRGNLTVQSMLERDRESIKDLSSDEILERIRASVAALDATEVGPPPDRVLMSRPAYERTVILLCDGRVRRFVGHKLWQMGRLLQMFGHWMARNG